MPPITLNYPAMLVAGLAYFALGALWYSPVLFGNMWMHLMGLKKETMNKGSMGKMMAVSVIVSLIMADVLAHFVGYIGANNWMLGLQTGFWAWVGFVATTMALNYMYGSKPFKLYVIDTAYHLVGLLLMGAILGGWR